MAHHPLVTRPQTAGPLAPPFPHGREGAGLTPENHMNTVIAITAVVAGAIGITLAAWHGWKARRR
jgi:hypothetical protein